jgi:putative tricarboxylic transport membrane protein
MYVGNLVLLVLNLPLVGLFVRILLVPPRILYPLVLAVSLVGIWGVNQNVLEVWVGLGAGVLGYYMRRQDYPLAPCVLGLVLGGLLEQSLRQALVLSDGSWAVLVTRPVSAALLALSALSLAAPYLLTTLRRARGGVAV